MKRAILLLVAGTLCACKSEPISRQGRPSLPTYGVGDGIVPDLLHPRYRGGFYDYQMPPQTQYDPVIVPDFPTFKKYIEYINSDSIAISKEVKVKHSPHHSKSKSIVSVKKHKQKKNTDQPVVPVVVAVKPKLKSYFEYLNTKKI